MQYTEKKGGLKGPNIILIVQHIFSKKSVTFVIQHIYDIYMTYI